MKKPTTAPAGVAGAPGVLTPTLLAAITEWNQLKEWLAKGSTREMELRKQLATAFVPKPKEGTNNVQGAGFVVKVNHKFSRTLDETALDTVMPELPEHLRVIGTLISYKPTFSTEVYRELSDQERKIFDQALTIKEGAPTLEIILSDVLAPATAPAAVSKPERKISVKPARSVPKTTKPKSKPAKAAKKR